METSNDTTNSTIAEYLPEDATDIRIYLTILLISSICSLLSNGIITLMLSNFRRLRKKKSNVIILHWSIISGIYLILEPSTLRLGLDWNDAGVPEEVFCILEEIENALLLLIIFLVAFLTKFWYYQYYNARRLDQVEKYFNYIMLAIYLITACFLLLLTESCISKRFVQGISSVALFFVFVIFVIFMIIINIIHNIKKRIYVESVHNEANVNYVLTNVFLLSTVPLLISILIVSVYQSSDLLVFIFWLISSCNPVYNLIILYKVDGDFNLFSKHVVKCKSDDYPEELEPELDNVRIRY